MPIFKTKNSDFFKIWSPEMAYVLGFFTADGNMIENKRGARFISIEITDKDILEQIREAIGSNHKIGVRKRKPPENNTYRLQIGSKEMFGDLIKLGITPNKSKTIDLPIIPDEYFADFVRGYFDGDGNVAINNYIRKDRKNKISRTISSGFTSGSKNFLHNLHVKLKGIAKISGGTLNYGNGSYRLYFSVNDSWKLYKFMYNDKNNLFLERKKDKFEKYFDNVKTH
jgi:intein-encoded DNA endonuclease-like protein